MKREYFKVPDVAEKLGLSTRTIKRRIADGTIRAIKEDRRNSPYLIKDTEIERFLKSMEV